MFFWLHKFYKHFEDTYLYIFGGGDSGGKLVGQ